jgi:hypothetical protein
MMPRLNALWLLVACGYMVPFTSIGSLIAYFNYTYGPKFYVKLYCAFYLPGWPISELQRRFDEPFDRKVRMSVEPEKRIISRDDFTGHILRLRLSTAMFFSCRATILFRDVAFKYSSEAPIHF